MMKTSLLALAMVAGLAAPAFATEVFIPGTAYSSYPTQGNSGTDAFGNGWLWNTTTSSFDSPGPGYSAWGTPGLGKGEATYGSDTPANDFQVTFLGFTDAAINTTPTAEAGGYNEYTRFSAGGVLWTPVYNGTDVVTFIAPSGTFLTKGEQYFVNITFGQKDISGANEGFQAGFSHDSAAPEPAAWSLMILGVGGMGAALRTRRRKAVAA